MASVARVISVRCLSALGDVRFYGDLPALGKHVSDIVAIAPTTDGNGYYLVGAKFHGSLPGGRTRWARGPESVGPGAPGPKAATCNITKTV